MGLLHKMSAVSWMGLLTMCTLAETENHRPFPPVAFGVSTRALAMARTGLSTGWTVTVTVRAWQTRAGAEDARMALEVEGAAVQTVNVPNLAAMPGEFSTEFMAPRAGAIAVGHADPPAPCGMERLGLGLADAAAAARDDDHLVLNVHVRVSG